MFFEQLPAYGADRPRLKVFREQEFARVFQTLNVRIVDEFLHFHGWHDTA